MDTVAQCNLVHTFLIFFGFTDSELNRLKGPWSTRVGMALLLLEGRLVLLIWDDLTYECAAIFLWRVLFGAFCLGTFVFRASSL